MVRNERSILYPLGKVMIISVAFFFFISAYGLALSFRNKKDYLNGFLLRKCGYIVFLILITYIFNITVAYISPVKTKYYPIKECLPVHIFYNTNWYLWELLLLYMVFYIVYKYLYKYRYKAAFAIVISASVLFLCWIL